VLEVTLRAQRLSGRFSADEVRDWRHWLREARGHTTDAVADREDWVPAVVDTAAHLLHSVRYPRSFLRQRMLNR